MTGGPPGARMGGGIRGGPGGMGGGMRGGMHGGGPRGERPVHETLWAKVTLAETPEQL